MKGKLSNVTGLLGRPRGSGRISANTRTFANHSWMCDQEVLKMGLSCRCDEASDVPLRRVVGWGAPDWEKTHADNCARAQEANDVDVVWYGDSITGAPDSVDDVGQPRRGACMSRTLKMLYVCVRLYRVVERHKPRKAIRQEPQDRKSVGGSVFLGPRCQGRQQKQIQVHGSRHVSQRRFVRAGVSARLESIQHVYPATA